MKIDVSDILKSINKETKEEVTYDFDSFQSRLGDFPIRSKSPVILRIANQENKKLLIQGTEIDYLIGFELDVDKLVYAEILVNWPMRVLCKDDCKGICKVCGMNLNKGACNCQRTELDPRMAAIQDIFNKFKEV